MVTDGERVKALLQTARRRVILCAPFIKAKVLRTVLSVIDPEVPASIVTRWRSAEVAAGVSDLEALEIAKSRSKTELLLLDDLHAKLYVADEHCLVGSANLTASALGWANRNNIELLVPASIADPEIAFLLHQLERAELATSEIRDKMRAESALLESVQLAEAQDMTSAHKYWHLPWLPRCAAPDRLYEMYKNKATTAVARGTRNDGLADIRDFNLNDGMSEIEFENEVQTSLRLMPTIAKIIREVPKGLTDVQGEMLISRARPDMDQNDVKSQWRIVRDWITIFFQDEIEVAPASFITRLKP